MTLEILVASLLTLTSPPGRTGFSVELASDCAPDATECEGARRSSFYGAWVRKESEATAAKRYELNAARLVATARRVLCLDEHGNPTCERTRAQKRWRGVEGLVALGAAVATFESGWREDVAVGRGKNGKPSDDGGQGRGPGGERCALQIHPTVLDDDRLLGSTPEALDRCFEQGLSMLVHARDYCARQAPKVEVFFATVSLYGTGRACNSPNAGKTALRANLARRMFAQLRKAVTK